MDSKSDDMGIMINEADEAINELFDSLKNRYQNKFQFMNGSELVFHYVHLLHYRWHKISLNCGRSNKSTKNNECFQNTITVTLNHEEKGKHSERITKIKPFINKYNWEGIHFPSEKKLLKKNR